MYPCSRLPVISPHTQTQWMTRPCSRLVCDVRGNRSLGAPRWSGYRFPKNPYAGARRFENGEGKRSKGDPYEQVQSVRACAYMYAMVSSHLPAIRPREALDGRPSAIHLNARCSYNANKLASAPGGERISRAGFKNPWNRARNRIDWRARGRRACCRAARGERRAVYVPNGA